MRLPNPFFYVGVLGRITISLSIKTVIIGGYEKLSLRNHLPHFLRWLDGLVIRESSYIKNSLSFQKQLPHAIGITKLLYGKKEP